MKSRTKELIKEIIIGALVILFMVVVCIIVIHELPNSYETGLAYNTSEKYDNAYTNLTERLRSMDSTSAFFIVLILVGGAVFMLGVIIAIHCSIRNKKLKI